jgi:hypothetical protein
MTAVALPVQDRNLGCRVEPGHVLGELFDVVEPLQHRLPGELRHPGGGQIAANGGLTGAVHPVHERIERLGRRDELESERSAKWTGSCPKGHASHSSCPPALGGGGPLGNEPSQPR